ncbi:hypothetical protein [Ferrimonas senticii]|uniref:hypothetical protein n=1 Tax=Ferrimonas senticii TaxID=394566 RepID=UPI0004217CBC|nr:hypothetical protein [Ferrimonas senticii]
MSREDLIKLMAEHLQQQLQGSHDDPLLAPQLAAAFYDAMLDWQAPQLPADSQVGAIIACAFGYQRQPNGNITAGAMNQQLAQLVIQLQRQHQCPAYLQWEIAEALADGIDQGQVISINPDIHPQNATVNYLSTQGVIDKVAQQVPDPSTLGKVLVVAWRHHITRCVQVARDAGFDAYAPTLSLLPYDYDPCSGQIWTRNPRDYLLHDVLVRLKKVQARLPGR